MHRIPVLKTSCGKKQKSQYHYRILLNQIKTQCKMYEIIKEDK